MYIYIYIYIYITTKHLLEDLHSSIVRVSREQLLFTQVSHFMQSQSK